MIVPLHIRRYVPGDEATLFEVFYSAVHRIACRDYSPEQIEAWAPRDLDMTRWQMRIRAINPFVAVADGQCVGYADVQPDGYIDHFYVSGHHGRRGIGSALMGRINDEAKRLGIAVLSSHVSRTAQPFFARFGFIIEEQRHPEVRGVVVPNARMSRTLTRAP